MTRELDIAKKCAATMIEADAASRRLGISVEVTRAGQAEARVEVTADMINGFDVCHGGYIFTLADTAFAFACNAYDDVTVAGSGTVEFLRPALLGDQLRAVATEEHRGKRSGLYAVEVLNQQDESVALFRGRAVARGESLLQD